MSILNNNLFSRLEAYKKVRNLIQSGEYAGNTLNLKKYTSPGSNASYWNGKYREHFETLQNRELEIKEDDNEPEGLLSFTITREKYETTKTEHINFIHNVNFDIGYDKISNGELKILFNKFIDIHRQEIGEHKTRIIIDGYANALNEDGEYSTIKISNPIGSVFTNKNNVVNDFMRDKIIPKNNEYKLNYLHITKLTISFIIPNNSVMGHSNFKFSKQHNLTEAEINKLYNNIDYELRDTATRTIEQGLKKFYITDPRTTNYNCLFQSVAVCINYKNNINYLLPTAEGDKLRSDSGANLKYNVSPNNKFYSDNQTIQEISDYKKCIICVYNNLFQLTDTINPKELKQETKNKKTKETETLNIQRNGNHCLSLILRSDLKKAFSNSDDEIIKNKFENLYNKKLEEKLREPNLLDIPIKRKANFDKLNTNIGSYDLETTPDLKGNHITYAAGLAYYDSQGEIKAVQKWGIGSCIKELFSFMHDNKPIFNNKVMYGHNGGKYDIPLILRDAFITSDIWRIDGNKCVELGGRWIAFEIVSLSDPTFRIIFRDSMAILGGSLKKLTNELDVIHKKLDESINHTDITLINYNSYGDILKDYLNNDVMGLLEVMTKYNNSIYESLKIDSTKCYTGASLSKKNYFKNYYNPNKYPIYSLSDEHDKFIRNSYYGGRNECFNLGNYEEQITEESGNISKSSKLYYFDFTSLYPSVGRKKLPYGEPKDIIFNTDDKPVSTLPNGFFGFVSCRVRTKDRSALPKHCIYKDSRLIFPIFDEWTDITIFSAEIDFKIYDYEFIKGISFNSSNFLDKFFTDGFNKKAEAKKDHQPALTSAYKTIINSGYGFWALRTKDRDGLKIFDETNKHGFIEYLNTDKLLSISEHGKYTFARVLNDLDIKDFNIAIGAAISSYARLRLHELITAIRNKGGIVYYCDTDSVITNLNIADYPDIQRNFQFDADDDPGTQLGSLKDEGTELVDSILRKIRNNKLDELNKFYLGTNTEKLSELELKNAKNLINDKYDEIINKELKSLRIREGGNFKFKKLTLSGCKQYSLIFNIVIDGKTYTKEINKLKGYSKNGISDKPLNYETMADLHKGNGIKQTVSQFRNPMNNYTNTNKNLKNMIKTVEVVKRFRCIYTKGNIGLDGIITPLIIGTAPTIA